MTNYEISEMLRRDNKEKQGEIIKTITTKPFKDIAIAELFINKIIENGVFYQIYGGTNYSKKDNGDRFNDVYNMVIKDDFNIAYKGDLNIETFKHLIKDMELVEKEFLIKMLDYEYELNLLKTVNKEKYLKLAQEVLDIALSLDFNKDYIKFALFKDIIYCKQNWYFNKTLWTEENIEKIKNVPKLYKILIRF